MRGEVVGGDRALHGVGGDHAEVGLVLPQRRGDRVGAAGERDVRVARRDLDDARVAEDRLHGLRRRGVVGARPRRSATGSRRGRGPRRHRSRGRPGRRGSAARGGSPGPRSGRWPGGRPGRPSRACPGRCWPARPVSGAMSPTVRVPGRCRSRRRRRPTPSRTRRARGRRHHRDGEQAGRPASGGRAGRRVVRSGAAALPVQPPTRDLPHPPSTSDGGHRRSRSGDLCRRVGESLLVSDAVTHRAV